MQWSQQGHIVSNTGTSIVVPIVLVLRVIRALVVVPGFGFWLAFCSTFGPKLPKTRTQKTLKLSVLLLVAHGGTSTTMYYTNACAISCAWRAVLLCLGHDVTRTCDTLTTLTAARVVVLLAMMQMWLMLLD